MKIKLFLLLFPILIASCTTFEDIKIDEVKQYTVDSLKNNELKLKLGVKVINPTLYPFKIQELDLKTRINGRYIGKVSLDTPVKVKMKSETIVEVPVTLKISNVFVTAFLMLNLNNGGEVKINLKGNCTARSMLMKKQFEVDENFTFSL